MTEQAQGPDDRLATVCGQVIRLLDAGTTKPVRLKVRTPEVSVEMEWGAGAPAEGDSSGPPGILPVVLPQVMPAGAAVPAMANGAAAVNGNGSAPVAGPGEAPAGDSDAPDAETFQICAPAVGTFYCAPEPGAAPFVAVGDFVEPGQQVAILEAMKLMNPIEADRAGRVIDICVPDATPVEFDQPIFVLAAS